MMRNTIIIIAVVLGINNLANAFVLNVKNNTDKAVTVISFFDIMQPFEIEPHQQNGAHLATERDAQTGNEVSKQLRPEDISVISDSTMSVLEAVTLGKSYTLKRDIVLRVNKSIAAKSESQTVNFPEDFKEAE